MDTRKPRVIAGSRTAFFGYTVQQHDISGKKWLVVGAPLETNGQQKTGDVYKCPVIQGNCTKLNLGKCGRCCLLKEAASSSVKQALRHVHAHGPLAPLSCPNMKRQGSQRHPEVLLEDTLFKKHHQPAESSGEDTPQEDSATCQGDLKDGSSWRS
ncbi:Hypothetical predicted protein [Marmota monax]|uniref:Uncharacterized protein n=1 Tax=Marmota monax TaxID=9995 RepID=A0A5E4C119_MARMO|nr:Hypothetical predicted protein [Marmota monax]